MKYKRKFHLQENKMCVHNAIEQYLEENNITSDCVITYAYAKYIGMEEDIHITTLGNVSVMFIAQQSVILGGKDISRDTPELLLIYGHTFIDEVVLVHGEV